MPASGPPALPEAPGAAALAAAITAKRTTAAAAMLDCMAHIAVAEDQIGAWQYLDPPAALAAAAAVDAGLTTGRLAGVAVGVKDLIDTADMPTTYGSEIFEGHRPAADAACVGRLRRAGMILPGKTVTTEFAYFRPGKTANPANPAHTPGGSSSGSAAAVAAGMVPVALGTQTAGSTIRPAAFCGVVGYKPSFGVIDMAGVRPLAPSFDTMGIFARHVGDAALLAEILSDGAIVAEKAPARPPRLLVARTSAWGLAEPAMVAAFEAVLRLAEQAGATRRELVLPPGFDTGADLHDTIMSVEVARGFAELRARSGDRFSPQFRALCEKGDALAGQYAAAVEAAGGLAALFDELMGDADLVLTPSAPGEAPAGLGATGNPAFSRVWMLLQVPCLSLPAGRGPKGLPLGVQVIGRRGGDAALLGWAAWLAGVIGDWRGRKHG